MVEWRTAFPSRIRVYLIPTTTYHLCSYDVDIQKMAQRLNEVQTVYEFLVPLSSSASELPRVSRGGLTVQKKTELSYKKSPNGPAENMDESDLSLQNYFSVDDVSQQAIKYSKNLIEESTCRALSHDDLIILLCGEVVVRSTIDYKFEQNAALDAYSLISVLSFEEVCPLTESSNEICAYNNDIQPCQQVGVISLRRLPVVFPEINYTDVPQRARNMVSRYMITNIASFIANRTFSVFLSHHKMTGCLNETNWVGGERESYYADDFCQSCLKDYNHYKISVRYSRFSVEKVLFAVRAMTKVIDRFDETLLSSEKASLWLNVALVAVSLNIVDAIFVDVVWREHEELKWPEWIQPWLLVKPHWPALFFAAVVALFGGFYLLRHFQRHRNLP